MTSQPTSEGALPSETHFCGKKIKKGKCRASTEPAGKLQGSYRLHRISKLLGSGPAASPGCSPGLLGEVPSTWVSLPKAAAPHSSSQEEMMGRPPHHTTVTAFPLSLPTSRDPPSLSYEVSHPQRSHQHPDASRTAQPPKPLLYLHRQMPAAFPPSLTEPVLPPPCRPSSPRAVSTRRRRCHAARSRAPGATEPARHGEPSMGPTPPQPPRSVAPSAVQASRHHVINTGKLTSRHFGPIAGNASKRQGAGIPARQHYHAP